MRLPTRAGFPAAWAKADISPASSACWRCASSGSPALRGAAGAGASRCPPNSEKALGGDPIPTGLNCATSAVRRATSARDPRRGDKSRSPSSPGADEELMFADKICRKPCAAAGSAGRCQADRGASITWALSRRRAEGGCPSSPMTSPRAACRGHSRGGAT